MGNGTSIGRVRGLGPAHSGAHHWLLQRLTAVGNLLLVLWLVVSLLLLPNYDYASVTEWLARPLPATAMVLRTADGDDLTVRVAEPGALVATKLQSVMNRGREKEGTDLLDIIRLTLDRSSGPASLRALEQADPRLRRDALLHALRWFEELDSRTLRIVRQVPEGKDVGADDIDLVAELLNRALRVT